MEAVGTGADGGNFGAVTWSAGIGVLGVAGTSRSRDADSCQENRGRSSLKKMSISDGKPYEIFSNYDSISRIASRTSEETGSAPEP